LAKKGVLNDTRDRVPGLESSVAKGVKEMASSVDHTRRSLVTELLELEGTTSSKIADMQAQTAAQLRQLPRAVREVVAHVMTLDERLNEIRSGANRDLLKMVVADDRKVDYALLVGQIEAQVDISEDIVARLRLIEKRDSVTPAQLLEAVDQV
jgi:hypothetical protein